MMVFNYTLCDIIFKKHSFKMSHSDVHFCRLLKINILLSFRITDNCHFLVCFRVEVFRQNVEQQIFYCHFLNNNSGILKVTLKIGIVPQLDILTIICKG